MRIHVASPEVAAALAPLAGADDRGPDGRDPGDDSSADGLVFAPRSGVGSWEEAEAELVTAFRLSRQAVIADAPVVYLLHADAVLGRAPALDSAVAAALVGGVRSLAFEGARRGRYATAIGIADDETPEALRTLSAAVAFATATRAASGQVVMLGQEHLGAMLP